MDAFYGALARVLLRYLAAILVSKGVLHDPASLLTPDTVQVITVMLGAACSAVAEGWWYLTHRRERKRDVDRDH